MNTQRTRQVSFRVSEAEWKEIRDCIRKSGYNHQNFLLKAALGERIYSLEDRESMAAITAEIGRQGNNLNQIARKLHQYGVIDPELQKEIEELKETWESLKRYLLKQV